MTCIAWWKAGAWCSAAWRFLIRLACWATAMPDVALHALMDAMLGAMALGDIGKHFPDTDNAYAGADSMVLLAKVTELLGTHHAKVTNCDITIVAQKPKLLPYIPRMRENVARVLGVDVDCVNVKATTTERLGFEGAQEGISAQAVCMVQVE